MAEIHLRVLRKARKRIHDRRNWQICGALSAVAAVHPELNHAAGQIRGFIQHHIDGPVATYRGWLCRNHPPAAKILRDAQQRRTADRLMRLYRLRVIDEVLRPHFENF